MSWLRKVGIALRTGLEVEAVLDPVLAPLLGLGVRFIDSKLKAGTEASLATAESSAPDTVLTLAKYVIMAETMIDGEKMGASRQVAVAPLALQALLASPLAVGKKLVDPVAAKVAAGGIAGSIAQFLNAFEAEEAQK